MHSVNEDRYCYAKKRILPAAAFLSKAGCSAGKHLKFDREKKALLHSFSILVRSRSGPQSELCYLDESLKCFLDWCAIVTKNENWKLVLSRQASLNRWKRLCSGRFASPTRIYYLNQCRHDTSKQVRHHWSYIKPKSIGHPGEKQCTCSKSKQSPKSQR